MFVGIDRNLRPWRIGRFYKQVHYVWNPRRLRRGVSGGDQLKSGEET